MTRRLRSADKEWLELNRQPLFDPPGEYSPEELDAVKSEDEEEDEDELPMKKKRPPKKKQKKEVDPNLQLPRGTWGLFLNIDGSHGWMCLPHSPQLRLEALWKRIGKPIKIGHVENHWYYSLDAQGEAGVPNKTAHILLKEMDSKYPTSPLDDPPLGTVVIVGKNEKGLSTRQRESIFKKLTKILKPLPLETK